MKKLLFTFMLIFMFASAFPAAAHAYEWVWAEAVKWQPGDLNGGSAGLGHEKIGDERYMTADALGEPSANANGGVDFLSLGLGGYAIFDFGLWFDHAAIVFETTWGDRTNYLETANVYVVGEGFNYNGLSSTAGVLDAGLSFDDFTVQELTGAVLKPLGGIDNQAAMGEALVEFPNETYRYLIIHDTTINSPSFDGYDVNAVGVDPDPVPVPGAVWLLGSGMLGLICFRRKMA
jgi:hypothetical protein